MNRATHWLAFVASLWTMPCGAVALPITAFSSATGTQLPAPWRIVTLPKIPRHTMYALAEADGRSVLRAEADRAYASAVHPVNADINATSVLRFRWRADRFPAGSDLRTKAGDDVAAKVCLLFDLPLERLRLVDRVLIEIGRRRFDPELPTATLCYVWDRVLPAGTWLPNAYTDRVRLLVLRSAQAGEAGRWFEERRDVAADFRRAFAGEATDRLPPLIALALATDADNTGDVALAWYGDLSLAAE